MSKKCKKMLQEAGVPALAELDDFVEAIQGVFDSLEEFQHGFLDLGAKDRMDLLKEINPDKALKWSIKVTDAHIVCVCVYQCSKQLTLMPQWASCTGEV